MNDSSLISADYLNGEYVLQYDGDVIDRFDLLILLKNRFREAVRLERLHGENFLENYQRIFNSQEKMQAVAKQKARQENKNRVLNRKANGKSIAGKSPLF